MAMDSHKNKIEDFGKKVIRNSNLDKEFDDNFVFFINRLDKLSEKEKEFLVNIIEDNSVISNLINKEDIFFCYVKFMSQNLSFAEINNQKPQIDDFFLAEKILAINDFLEEKNFIEKNEKNNYFLDYFNKAKKLIINNPIKSFFMAWAMVSPTNFSGLAYVIDFIASGLVGLLLGTEMVKLAKTRINQGQTTITNAKLFFVTEQIKAGRKNGGERKNLILNEINKDFINLKYMFFISKFAYQIFANNLISKIDKTAKKETDFEKHINKTIDYLIQMELALPTMMEHINKVNQSIKEAQMIEEVIVETKRENNFIKNGGELVNDLLAKIDQTKEKKSVNKFKL